MWVTHDLKEVTITSFRPLGGDRYSASVGSLRAAQIFHVFYNVRNFAANRFTKFGYLVDSGDGKRAGDRTVGL